MKILFIAYWSLDDALTTATIVPHLKILSSFSSVQEIVLFTIERTAKSQNRKILPKVKWHPFDSGHRAVYKVLDFMIIPVKLKKLCSEYGIDLILCRGSCAGALGYLTWKKTRIPFVVESFEPHAAYMQEAGDWKKWHLKYQLQKWWEQKQKKKAEILITVSHNFRNRLISENLDKNNIVVAPCAVNQDLFSFDAKAREEIRTRLGFTEDVVVGIYVGKFGGIYWDKEAFDIFKWCNEFYKNRFRLIILNQHNHGIAEKLIAVGFNSNQLFVGNILHDEVPQYLSASDFAFAFIKETPHRKYCSPVKIGEYWASGLPVLVPQGIGDDSEIISGENAGIVINRKLTKDFFWSLLPQLAKLMNGVDRRRISTLAGKYRSFETVKKTYDELLNRDFLK